MASQDITLRVTTEETNLILEALGNMAFVRVYALVGKVQEQAGAQLREASGAQLPARAVAPDE